MTDYTTAADVANYLGQELTEAQEQQAAIAAEAATLWIDRYLGQSWQAGTPVTDEMHTLVGNRVYLNNRPVAAVTSVQTRAAAFVAFGWTTLDASHYELLDAANGVLLIEGWSASSAALVQVSYTHTATTPPADVALAATMIAASWTSSAMQPGTLGVESLGVGQGDIAIKFAAGVNRADVPAEALHLLDGRRSFVIA